MAGPMATSAFATVGKARASYMGVAADIIDFQVWEVQVPGVGHESLS